MPFYSANDKILMIKIGIERITKKEMKVPKRNKSKKEAK